MRHSTEPVLHLANPNPIPWKEIFEPIAEELKVPLVPIRTWLALLQWNASNNFSTTTIVSKSERIKRNPAIRLIPYLLAADLRDGREPIGSTRLDLTKGLKIAPTLKNVRIGKEMAIEWVKNWRKTGFLPFPDPEISEQKLVARL